MDEATASIILAKLKGAADEPGNVIMSRLKTLRKGHFYLMGLNPGGIAEGTRTIRQTLRLPTSAQPTGWRDRVSVLPNDRIADRAECILAALSINSSDEPFTTNAVFRRSVDEKSLKDAWDHWWDEAWPVHQIMLAIVRPRLIVVMGKTAWEMLRTPKRKAGNRYQRLEGVPQRGQANEGTLCEGVYLDLGDGLKHCTTLLGLPHFSPSNTLWDLSLAGAKIRCARDIAHG